MKGLLGEKTIYFFKDSNYDELRISYLITMAGRFVVIWPEASLMYLI